MLPQNKWNRIQRLDRIRHELDVMEPTDEVEANQWVSKAAQALRRAIDLLSLSRQVGP